MPKKRRILAIVGRISKKRRTSTSSAAKIDGNVDLLTEILVLLPVKSVVRFKLVNRRWWNIISSDFFTRLHVQNYSRRRVETQHPFILDDGHGRPQFYICHPTVKNLVRVNLPRALKYHRNFEYVKILQSMNGLLLLSLKDLEEDRIDYVVFNPLTEQYRFIYLDGYRPHRPHHICLIFNPSKLEHYKLVMNTDAIPRFSVYDSATHQWSHGKESPLVGDALGFNVCRTLSHNLSIMLDDTSHTNPNLIQFPETEDYMSYIFYSNEYLNILQLKLEFPDENKLRFRVGAMIDDKWVICENSVLDFDRFDTSRVTLLGMMREERIEDSVFLFHVPGRLLTYKFSDDDLKVIVDYRSGLFYVEDELQFQKCHPFEYTFAPV